MFNTWRFEGFKARVRVIPAVNLWRGRHERGRCRGNLKGSRDTSAALHPISHNAFASEAAAAAARGATAPQLQLAPPRCAVFNCVRRVGAARPPESEH